MSERSVVKSVIGGFCSSGVFGSVLMGVSLKSLLVADVVVSGRFDFLLIMVCWGSSMSISKNVKVIWPYLLHFLH